MISFSILIDAQDSEDPKQSTADMTAFVQNLLQQMQSRFQTMSESIITKNILFYFDTLMTCNWGFKTIIILKLCALSGFLVSLITIALDEMGNRIDELEQSINDLRSEMGIEASAPSVPSKPKDEPKTGNDPS
ncbi:hypothetical protein Pint_24536 [Pistacia integerrima]|uniref:Uncharacterized protein n=1 Tax=Pistacia integerrima TaxID=434235 RepID=A0ACC0YE05_9ROSI|nr:hypothetical protein Pint_24536 [Pistacia integerrima]